MLHTVCIIKSTCQFVCEKVFTFFTNLTCAGHIGLVREVHPQGEK